MTPDDVAKWMHRRLLKDGCIYQEDVVDYLVRKKADELLRENADGNVVLAKDVLEVFETITGDAVVWVRPDRYWRWRVSEDEPGRDACG